jgi:Tol biopolymer transport system component
MNRHPLALPLGIAAGLILCLASPPPANGLSAALTLSASHGANAAPGTAPTGRIVFQNDACQIDTISPDGTDLVQVTDIQDGCAAIPAWSPDGSQIAFLVYPPRFDRASIYTINTDGTGLQQLVTDGAGYYDSYPTYTPDGQWVIYSRCRSDQKGGGCALYEIRLNGTHAHPLTRYGTGIGLHSP